MLFHSLDPALDLDAVNSTQDLLRLLEKHLAIHPELDCFAFRSTYGKLLNELVQQGFGEVLEPLLGYIRFTPDDLMRAKVSLGMTQPKE